MKSMKLNACYALASAAVVGIAACAGGTDGSSRIAAPGGSSASIITLSSPQTARLCKIGPVGSYNFDLVFSGTYGSDVQSSSPVTVTVTDASQPACVTVLTRVEGDNVSDPSATVAITEQTSPDYNLVAVADSGGSITQSSDLGTRTVTLHINAFHSAKATFTNEAVVHDNGCTFTMGWYKTHESQWPAGTLTPSTVFDGGATLITILNTPPKGSQYLILAHQYITALLNIQGGASVPSDVQAALNTAEDYFNGGGAGTGDPTVDITGVSTILDNYNNGLIGPGHCD
jgi:hypothetical protein